MYWLCNSDRGVLSPFPLVHVTVLLSESIKQYNIGEKPTVRLYTYYIDRHAGTPKPQSRNTVSLGVQYIWTQSSGLLHTDSNLVIEKVNFNLINMSIRKVVVISMKGISIQYSRSLGQPLSDHKNTKMKHKKLFISAAILSVFSFLCVPRYGLGEWTKKNTK